MGLLIGDTCPRCGSCWSHSFDDPGPCSRCVDRALSRANLDLDTQTLVVTYRCCGETMPLPGKPGELVEEIQFLGRYHVCGSAKSGGELSLASGGELSPS